MGNFTKNVLLMKKSDNDAERDPSFSFAVVNE